MIDYLADRFLQHGFSGVDLNVYTAQQKHPTRTFISGYALDLLESRQIDVDILFASSTFAVTTPLELIAYLQACGRAGVRHVLLSEPTWANWTRRNEPERSEHLEGAAWYHPYVHYLQTAGYMIRASRTVSGSAYSPRPDLEIVVLHAQLQDHVIASSAAPA